MYIYNNNNNNIKNKNKNLKDTCKTLGDHNETLSKDQYSHNTSSLSAENTSKIACKYLNLATNVSK